MVREDCRPPSLPPFLYGPATLYRREKNLKEILSPSLFLPALNKNESSISTCKQCDICRNDFISDNKLKFKVTGRGYSVRGSLSCNSLMLVTICHVKIAETSK